jgi:hypothetical protein
MSNKRPRSRAIVSHGLMKKGLFSVPKIIYTAAQRIMQVKKEFWKIFKIKLL